MTLSDDRDERKRQHITRTVEHTTQIIYIVVALIRSLGPKKAEVLKAASSKTERTEN